MDREMNHGPAIESGDNLDLLEEDDRRSRLRTLSMLVANKPGVLGRVCLVFSRRGYNIESLTVSHTLDRRFSRMVMTTCGEAEQLEDIAKHARNLIDVIHFTVLDNKQARQKRDQLIRIVSDPSAKPVVLGIIEEFRYRTVDFSNDSITVRAFAYDDEVETFTEILKRYGRIEKLSLNLRANTDANGSASTRGFA